MREMEIAIRVLAAGNAIDYGQPFFPVQDNVPLQEDPIAPSRIADGGANIMQVNGNENAVDLRNDERGDVAPQIRIVVRGAVLFGGEALPLEVTISSATLS